MSFRIKSIIISVLFLLIGVVSFSQEVKFTMQVGVNKAGLKDRFYVTFTSNQQGRLVSPKFKNFTIVGGISQGSSSSVRFENGRQTVTKSFTYQMAVQPKKLGNLTLEGTSIIVAGKTYKSNTAKVLVVKESQARKQPQRRNIFDDFFGKQQRQQVQEPQKDLFICKIIPSKTEVYLNESLTVTYKFYTRVNLTANPTIDLIPHENFWAENVPGIEKLQPKIEKINGVNHRVYILKKEVLFPQKTGKLKLNSFKIENTINQSFFGPGQKVNTKSNAPTITVKALPNNAPANFENQVGNYKMSVDFKADTITVDESMDLKITIKGKGNLKQMSGLETSFPEGFEVYDPEIKDRISVSSSGTSGSKTFNYLLIPRKAGKYTIEPISFSYFDIKTKKYKTLKTKTYNLVVLNEDGTINDAVILNEKEGEKKEVKIEEKTSFNWMKVLIPVGVLIIGLFLFFFIKKRKSKEETEEDRLKNARKILAKNLELAKSHLDNNEISQFYDEILIGLNKYVNDKLQLKTAEMNKENIVKNLQNKRVGEETISSFVSLIEQCEMAKYSPLSTSNNKGIYEKSLDVIGAIEKEI